jgi:H+-translocating NAD(P) transhydrogenase subunit alpha
LISFIYQYTFLVLYLKSNHLLSIFPYLVAIILLMTIGVLKESNGETRVSLLPEHIAALKKLQVNVVIESGAGENAFASNTAYETAGASISSRSEVLQNADIILSIHALSDADIANCKAKVLFGFYQPLFNAAHVKTLAEKNFTIFSIDMLPRTTRAQSMDVLSSQANIAGYKAVLLAANLYPKYFPMFMTAAGSIPPAKMLILGAGVAGLQAIATAKRLGAVVEVFDTRPQVKEEVMSLGAKFVEVEGAADAAKAGGYAVEQTEEFMARQKARIAESVAKSDIIITTAAIPGKKAPILITEEMLHSMKNGSVIIDLAASTGGNTSHTKNNETVKINGVSIVGNSALAADMPSDASKLYGKNILNFLQLIIDKEGNLNLNFEDDLVKGTCITHGGVVTNERVSALLNG